MTEINLNRREFLVAGASLAVAAGCKTDSVREAESLPGGSSGMLIASAPVLQNAAETSMGVSFAVSSDASGWVDYSESSDMKGAVRAYSGAQGLRTVDDKIALVRLTGLKPATRYFYRIGADRISYEHGYAMKNLGSESDPAVHSFTTLGSQAKGLFCVINDTHEVKQAIDLEFKKLGELSPSVVIWNGDASNVTESIDQALEVFIRPHAGHREYASDTPYVFLNGNHDFRGRFNRRLSDVMMFREPAERSGRHAELGRNFVQRLGEICLIGLDTGEDKLDTNPHFANIFRMQDYREKQADWLSEMVETPAVKSARWKVAFCHIPLFDPRSNANPGDLAPADVDPRYEKDYAAWQRTCARLWGPSLKKAGVNLVIAGHQHRFRYDPPSSDRPWAQIVGGGPDFGVHPVWKNGKLVREIDDARFPTVIEGGVCDGKLIVRVHDLFHGRLAGRYEF